MKNWVCFSFVLACVLLAGCGSSNSYTPSAAASVAPSDVMRVGDKITIRLTGVPDTGYFNEVQIPASGDISVDLLSGSFHAAGRTTSDLAADIIAAYKSQKIYTNPIVTVIPEERYINVGGDVRGPSRVVYSPDSTLMSAINSCGGFTEFANRRAVRILRGQQVIYVDCVKAAQTPGADPSVYPGDQIYVPRTAF
jgi:protein involved in polysaccharide export with SLBB domain